MKRFIILSVIPLVIILMSSNVMKDKLKVKVFETSASGNKLRQITEFAGGGKAVPVTLLPGKKFQTITGFGG